MNIEQIAKEALLEISPATECIADAVEATEFLRRCLAKLAVQNMEPIYQLSKANSSVSSAWIDVDEQTYSDAGLYPEYGRRRLYPEAQLLAVQQRTAEACAKDAARWNFFVDYMLSDRTDLDDGFVACTTKAAISEFVDEAIRNGEWRNHK